MPKSKVIKTGQRGGKTASTMTSAQMADRAILGLDRPKPFDQLSVAEQIQVFRNEIISLRKRIGQQSNTINKLQSRFKNHSHTKKGKVYLELEDIEYHDYESGANVESDFDSLR